jgi:glycosyltransferase involved in cell wall biosynthesis
MVPNRVTAIDESLGGGDRLPRQSMGTRVNLRMTSGVAISHPGTQHSYRTVRAAQDAGVLQLFTTSIFVTRGSVLDRAFRATGAVPLLNRLVSRVGSRSDDAIDPNRVRSSPLAGLAATSVRRLPFCGNAWRISEQLHDRRTARWIRETKDPPAILHGFEGSCLATLEAGRTRRIATVLDVPSAHECALEMYAREGITGIGPRNTARIMRERTFADILLAPSEFVAGCLVRNGVDEDRIVRVPYGVDPAVFTPQSSTAARGQFRVLFVGSVSHLKGARYLLEAWKQARLEDAELVLVGRIGKAAREWLRGAKSVRLLGQLPRRQVRQWFAQSDAFVLPSLAEGSALVTYEALASGLPVVTTPNSGSVVREGQDGFLVAPRDVDALVGALTRLRADETLCKELGASGRELIRANYTWDHYRTRLEDVYRRLLSSR